MAQKPIEGKDIIRDNALDNHIKQVREAKTLYEQMDAELVSIAKNLKTVAKGYSANKNDDIKKAVADEKALTQAILDQEKIKRAKIQTEKTLLSLEKQQATANAKAKRDSQLKNNVYKQESAQLTKLVNAYQNLAARGRENGKVARGLLQDITRLDTKLKGIDKTVGRNYRNVGNYTSALQGLRGTATSLISTFQKLGLTIGTAFIARNIGGIIADFSQAQGDLLAISGKTADELEKLTAQAKNLGETTQFSATQITLMQVELAKLGFTVQQIEESTEPVANFAAATGVELPRAASLAGSALRAFGLEAVEMERVVSTLGVATTKSALDFSQLEAGLSTVAPVANAFGFTIEETTALLGSLSNAGFDASSSATATRNILLNLADANGDLAKALGRPVDGLEDLVAGLKDLDAKGVDLAETLELTDKRSVAAFNTFLKGTDTISELKESITGANQELEDMAKKRLDTVGGQLTLLKSAWEGFILGADGATGASQTLKNVLGFLAKNLSSILGVVTKVALGWAVYKTAIVASNVASKAGALITTVRTTGLKSLFVSQTASTGATVAGTTAQTGLNTAMKLNPIGLLVTGLVALAYHLDLFSSAAERARKKQEALNNVIKEGNDLAEQNIEKSTQATNDFLANEQKEFLKALGDEKKTKEQIAKIVEKSASQIRFNAIQEKKALQDLITEGQKRFKQAAGDGELRAKISGELEVYAQREVELEKIVSDSRTTAWNWYFDKVKATNEEKNKQAVKDKANGNDEKDRLTGLAKLSKELTDLEKERSDYLVANGGVMDSKFFEYTEQVVALEENIDSLKQKLGERGIGYVAPKQVEGVDKNGNIILSAPKDTLAKDNDETVTTTTETADALKKVSQNLTDITIMLANKRIEALDREAEQQRQLFEQSKTREQQIIDMRSASNVSLTESLAYEKQAQAQALKEQEKIAKKKARIEMFNSGLTLLNSYVQKGGGVGNVVGDMTTLTAALEGLVPAFWTGTDTTVGDSLGIKYSSGRDGILARVDQSEMILNKSKVDTLSRYGVNSTDDIVQRVKMGSMFNAPTTTAANKIINVNNSELVSELQTNNKLLQQIASKPNSQLNIEQLGNVVSITEKVTKGNKTVTTSNHKRLGR